ncbi:MAG: DUF4446 family protein [Candidatus Zambryskibacteria bacterium]
MIIDWNLVVFFIPFVALASALSALVFSIAMHIRVKRIFKSANTPDIERLLKLHTKTLEDLIKFQAESTAYMKSLDNRIKKKIINASTVRFNPFHGEGVGGNQSFSVSLADEEGNGVVVTGMHTRERTNVFAKPLKSWVSEYELSEEERQAVKNQRQTNDERKK